MYDIIGRVKRNVLPDLEASEQDLACKFCNFLVDKITNIRERLKDNFRFVVQKEGEPEMLEFNQVSESYVQKIIGESMATNCTADPMPFKLINKFKVYSMPVITTQINLSLRSGTFAKDWKLSTVRPFIKKPNLSKELKNYKLVNNLCIISKYVYKAMLEQLNTYMTTKNLLPDYISAYRKNFSMETVLVKILHDILKAFEEQKGVLLTGLDLSAAFDTVDHNIFIMVLKNMYSIGGLALECFKDYLRNRVV